MHSFELSCSVFGPIPLWLALVALYRPFVVTLFLLDLISSPHISGDHAVGPCHHSLARPQVLDRGTASDKEGSCE